MRKPKLHVLRILDRTGDTRVAYDPTDERAIREVAARFLDLMTRNFIALDISTQPSRVLTAFDPAASAIVVSRPIP